MTCGNEDKISDVLRADVSKSQTSDGNTQKIDLAHTFMFCCILYPNYRRVVYFSKYDLVFEKYLFLSDRVNVY